jgi:hypothetical protein
MPDMRAAPVNFKAGSIFYSINGDERCGQVYNINVMER